MVRYGVITWIPLYLFKTNNFAVKEMGKVGLNVFLIPVAGVLGTLIYNSIKVKKDLITVIFLIFLAISFVVFPFTSGLLATIVLLVGSFFLYGPHVFLVTTMPSRFHDKQVVAASAGFIDGMGYIGTVLIGVIVPVLVTSSEGSWSPVFTFWAILSALVAVTVAIVYATHFRFNENKR
jgi:sugar phosphate permease